jgi:hypothetical protein
VRCGAAGSSVDTAAAELLIRALVAWRVSERLPFAVADVNLGVASAVELMATMGGASYQRRDQR